MSDFKFNIEDIVEYKKRVYRICGRTEYQLTTAKGLNHENTYSLTPADKKESPGKIRSTTMGIKAEKRTYQFFEGVPH